MAKIFFSQRSWQRLRPASDEGRFYAPVGATRLTCSYSGGREKDRELTKFYVLHCCFKKLDSTILQNNRSWSFGVERPFLNKQNDTFKILQFLRLSWSFSRTVLSYWTHSNVQHKGYSLQLMYFYFLCVCWNTLWWLRFV